MNNSNTGCPSGYHKRKSYTIKKTGKVVESKCVRVAHAKTARLRNYNIKNLSLNKTCKRGYILRKPYVRKFQSSTKRTGYSVKRGNKTYRVYPKTNSVLVKASCIKDQGLPGSQPNSIGPLRKGDLSKYGYNAKYPKDKRHSSLRKAIEEYGALEVFRKLDAVAKLSVRRAPLAAHVFKKDRDWVRSKFTLKAF